MQPRNSTYRNGRFAGVGRFVRNGKVSRRRGAVLLLLVIVQFVWIAVLQYNLYTLTEQARIQQTRIAQLEQSVKKHNNLLYSTEITMQDIEKMARPAFPRIAEYVEVRFKSGNSVRRKAPCRHRTGKGLLIYNVLCCLLCCRKDELLFIELST